MDKMKISEFFKQLEQTDEYHFESAKLDFALELKRIMDRDKVKGAELAKVLDVSAPMVSKWLRGDANVTLETMVRISRALSGKLYIKIARNNCNARFFELAEQVRPTHRAPAVALDRGAGGDAFNFASNDYEILGQENEVEPLAA